MQIRTDWTTKAIKDLDKIYSYYSKKNSLAATRIYNAILDSVGALTIFPEMAPLEPLLSDSPKKYRMLIVLKRFKVIYYLKDHTIYISAIWDCRQRATRLQQLFNH